MEDFVTLFDHKFLPQGLALHASLQQLAGPCHLWVICMDQTVFDQLGLLSLPGLTPIHLRELENEELLRVKRQRTRAEYCWTLTPFACRHVLGRASQSARVTYVDADVVFFGSPAVLLGELEQSGKTILITEHAYAPEYAHLERIAGRFCVQFLTFTRGSSSIELLNDWGAKCLEACSSVPGAASGFGDQAYLDEWPVRFDDRVHILRNTAQTLAPWNVDHFQDQAGSRYLPVLYHFHGFRILGRTYARYSSTYPIRLGDHIYAEYLNLLREQCRLLRAHGLELPAIPISSERFWLLRTIKRILFQHMVIRRHSLF